MDNKPILKKFNQGGIVFSPTRECRYGICDDKEEIFYQWKYENRVKDIGISGTVLHIDDLTQEKFDKYFDEFMKERKIKEILKVITQKELNEILISIYNKKIKEIKNNHII